MPYYDEVRNYTAGNKTWEYLMRLIWERRRMLDLNIPHGSTYKIDQTGEHLEVFTLPQIEHRIGLVKAQVRKMRERGSLQTTGIA